MSLITEPRLQTIAERYFEAWGDRDPDRIAELHTQGTVSHFHDGGEPVEGRPEVRRAFASFFDVWPNFRFELNRVLYGESHWVVEWTMHVRPANGARAFRLSCVDVATVTDEGLVSRKDTYVDGPGI